MRTLNTEEIVPDIFYIFVNKANNSARQQYETSGVFYSTGYASIFYPDRRFFNAYSEGTLDFIDSANNPHLVPQISPFCSGVTGTAHYPLEHAFEVYRREHYRYFPSRLSAVYAFGDINTCENVEALYHWNIKEVRQFELLLNIEGQIISEQFPSQRITKHNMEIISFLRGNGGVNYPHLNDAMEMYWSGCGEIELPDIEGNIRHIDVIHEYLVDGMVKRMNDNN
ncbi:hypothetical protein EC412_23955 [Salmonella enterica subsp. enterica serovar Redlands]|nr:hypothetical protein [Salmonella enterica subsp. enterica serovar Redlands]